jgi:hypothetical protein
MGRPAAPKTLVHDLWINEDYFLRHQETDPDTGCIRWNGGMHRQGYGMCGAWRVSDGERIMTTTHRIAARIAFGTPLTSDQLVIHTCSNMNCMNPEHLQIGTNYDMHIVMKQNQRYRHTKRKAPVGA